ncbi:ficolin-1-like [Saccostrea cucullata]|uniref:ficolin-1-like n=1 Tax=Saccostrea cuccullata TaxID=36930 RepID=UPI002ED5D240
MIKELKSTGNKETPTGKAKSRQVMMDRHFLYSQTAKVIQKRQDGDVDFYMSWLAYKHGFGNASKNYWIGNDAIHTLTKDKNQELRVDLERYNERQAYAVYSTFYIGHEVTKYILTVSGYNGTAGDSLDEHNGMQFSTYDQDNDIVFYKCAVTYHGAWWYKDCYNANLNGLYSPSPNKSGHFPIWKTWVIEALRKTMMMIRPRN